MTIDIRLALYREPRRGGVPIVAKTPVGWDLAGLTDLETGSVDRPMPGAWWHLPAWVAADGDRLYWSLTSHGVTRIIPRTPGPGMLDGFVALADAAADRICAYAARWGTLQLCEHGLPSDRRFWEGTMRARCGRDSCPLLRLEGEEYEPFAAVVGPIEPIIVTNPSGAAFRLAFQWLDGAVYWEPLESWRRYARQARAMLNLIAALREGESGSPDDWAAAVEASGRPRGAELDPAGEARALLADAVNGWLAVAGVYPSFRWLGGDVDSGTIEFGGGGLFGAFAVQLLLHAARSDGLAFCSGCGTAYTPLDRTGRPRRPQPNRRHYCLRCRELNVPQRDAAAAYRQRKRAHGER